VVPARDVAALRLRRGRPSYAPSQSGFTLIEILIVMVLLVILATTGLALYTNSVTRAKEATLKQDLFQMRDVISQYYADKNRYPPTLDTLVQDKYLRTIPVDPVTNSPDTWQTVLSEPEPGNPAAAMGVFDVKSGSDATALDGTRYSDW
jgi:general secretion pathway protein G